MLYFVGTPIGNLDDMTFRAVETLKSVDCIACEDTRHSLALLNRYGIKKPLFSFHKFNEKETGEKIVEKLKNGENIAVISDAGMPVISDPGGFLVKTLIEEELEYTVIPGATAFATALVLSGFSADKCCFLGFLPDTQEKRRAYLEKYKDFDGTLIFYSAPHDIVKDVGTLFSAFGDRKACACKELTKIHERAIRFNLKDGFTEEERGEFVLIVEGAKNENVSAIPAEELLKKYLAEGMGKNDAVKRVAKEKGASRQEIYKLTIKGRTDEKTETIR